MARRAIRRAALPLLFAISYAIPGLSAQTFTRLATSKEIRDMLVERVEGIVGLSNCTEFTDDMAQRILNYPMSGPSEM